MKTYRIEEGTLEQIQALKEFYQSKGFDPSDAGIIQMAVSAYMDIAIHDIEKRRNENGD